MQADAARSFSFFSSLFHLRDTRNLATPSFWPPGALLPFPFLFLSVAVSPRFFFLTLTQQNYGNPTTTVPPRHFPSHVLPLRRKAPSQGQDATTPPRLCHAWPPTDNRRRIAKPRIATVVLLHRVAVRDLHRAQQLAHTLNLQRRAAVDLARPNMRRRAPA